MITKKWKKICLTVTTLFLIIWFIVICFNVQKSNFEIVNIPVNEKLEYQGIDLKIRKTQLWNGNDFLKDYGEDCSSFFEDYPIEKTKVVVCEVEIDNIGKSDVSAETIWNSHLRVNRGLATYFEPFLTSQLNDIFAEEEQAGIIHSNTKETIALYFPLYDDTIPEKIWKNLIKQQFALCIPDKEHKTKMYEFSLKVGEHK